MAQFISDTNASPLGGLFSLGTANGAALGLSDGNGFKIAMSQVEDSQALSRQPLGLAVASNSLPVGKELPALTHFTSSSLTQLELDQLSFAADAMGLALPSLLKESFMAQLAAGIDIQSEEFAKHVQDEVASLGDSEGSLGNDLAVSDVIPQTDDVALLGDVSTPKEATGLSPYGVHTSHDVEDISVSSLGIHSLSTTEDISINSPSEVSLNNDFIDIENVSLNMGAIEQPLETNELNAFVAQWLNTKVTILSEDTSLKTLENDQLNENDAQATVTLSLSEILENYPSPKDWHAIKIDVVENTLDANDLGVGVVTEKSLLQVITDVAKQALASEEFIHTLSPRTNQPEALTQQFLRHFTSQVIADIEPSSISGKEGAAIDGASFSKLTSEGLKFIQGLLDERPTVERMSSQGDYSGNSNTFASAITQRSGAMDAVSIPRSEALPVNPQRPDFQWQMEQRIQWMLSRGLQTADIRVDPPELGTIHIRVTQQGDQTQIVFTSQHANVRDALENSLPRLREMFEQQGLNLAQTDVRDQGGRSQRDTNADNTAHNNSAIVDEEEPLVVTRAIGLVDTHA
jgi:hypothetical protein